MKYRFPGFRKCMEMMRKQDAQTQENGFHALLTSASEHVAELVSEFAKERDPGLRCWLLELIGEAKSAEAFDFLVGQLDSDDESFRYWAAVGLKKLNTKEARKLLWERGLH